jgi:hypothetical protein
MQRLQIIFIVLIFICSCQTKTSNSAGLTNSTNIKTTKQNKRFSPVDTLKKYSGSDTLNNYGTYPFYVGSANKREFGFIQTTDSTSIIYQREGENWKVTDTFKFPLYRVTKIDLNGDGYQDLEVTYSVTAAGNNSENLVFIFNPKTSKFRHNKYYDLPNIQFDKSKGIIHSAWWASAALGQNKETYKITGDSLNFDQGISYSPKGKPHSDIASIEFYTLKGDSTIVNKRITGNSKRLWKMFEKALWDTSID